MNQVFHVSLIIDFTIINKTVLAIDGNAAIEKAFNTVAPSAHRSGTTSYGYPFTGQHIDIQ